MAKVKKLSTHSNSLHTCFVMSNGTAKACGANGTSSEKGLLGVNSNELNVLVPAEIPGLTDVAAISCGRFSTAALLNDGTVKVWGKNANGQLGLGNKANQVKPVSIPNLTGAKAISCGQLHCMALLEGGIIKSWGDNTVGQLGIGGQAELAAPVRIPNLIDVTAISCGLGHSAALLKDGTVKMWGQNTCGELGLGDQTNRLTPVLTPNLTDVAAISCGCYHSAALLKDGTVKVWGQNTYGQLGLGDQTNHLTPVLTPNLTDVAAISCGYYHSAALLKDGTVKVWGMNTNGQLGLGDTAPRNVPELIPGLTGVVAVSCGSNTTYVLLNDGIVMSIGANSNGQLGTGNTADCHTPTAVTGLTNTSAFLYLTGAKLYTEKNNAVVKIADDYNLLTDAQKNDYFAAALETIAPIDQLSALGQVKILAYVDDPADAPEYTINALAKDKLVAPQNLIATSRYEGINKVTLIAALSGGAALKTIVTTDLNSYKTYKNGAWQDIDPTDLAAVAANGIDYADLPNIPRAAWDTLLSGVNKLGFAYLPTIAATTDQCEVDELILEVDLKDAWEMALPGTDYTYGYPDQSTLRVTIKTNGEYKINYAE